MHRMLPMLHTSIASPRLRLLLLGSAKAKCRHNRLPKGVGWLPGWLGTKGRHRRRLPKGWLVLHASKSWLRLAILLRSACKCTCRCRKGLSQIALRLQSHARHASALTLSAYINNGSVTPWICQQSCGCTERASLKWPHLP